MAVLSMNHRPGDVQIPLIGHVGDHEVQFSAGWPSSMPSLSSQTPLTLYRNRAHTEQLGVLPNVNEFGIYDGSEWSALKALAGGGGSTPTRNRLVPTSAPPHLPYPDPYSHTLRHEDAAPLAFMPDVLSSLDLSNGMTASWLTLAGYGGEPGTYRHPLVNAASSNLEAIGHGIWPGYRDQMRVADLDGDGRLEVVFGNLDGYVHILEFVGSEDSEDPYRLIDEWRSPPLGRAVFACDATFAGGKATLYFANGRGEIHKMWATGANAYHYHGVIASPETASPKYLYDGSTPLLLVGNLDANSAGSEILVMNRFFDWSVFTTAGVRLANGRLPRAPRAVGPADAFITEIGDPDGSREVMVGAGDSMVWMLDRDPPLIGTDWEWEEPVARIIPFTGLVIAKAVPCHFNGFNNPPSHVLVFGDNSDRNDAGPGIGTSVIQLWEPALQGNPPLLVSELDTGSITFDETMAFAWVSKPTAGAQSMTASFAVATGTCIATYAIDVDVSPPSSPMSKLLEIDTLGQELERTDNVDIITSLDFAKLDDGSGSFTKQALVYCTSKGRIFVCDASTLAPLRSALQEADDNYNGPYPTDRFNLRWHSNRTLAQTPACTLPASSDGAGDFYFAETALSFRESNSGGSRRYRIGKVTVGASASNGWTPFVAEAEERFEWRSFRPQWLRTLIYEDLDPVLGGAEFRLFAETGCAFLDDRLDPPLVREFQTASYQPLWMDAFLPTFNGASSFWADKGPWISSDHQGGYVYEREVRPQGAMQHVGSREYHYLGGWDAPTDPTRAFFDRGGTGWWYPRVNTAAYMDGQIASTSQSAHPLSLGTSMKRAQIWSSDPADSGQATVTQIVVGTTGGYVYCIRPGATSFSGAVNGELPSKLMHVSPKLGTYIVGLDVGDVDGDPDQEIVCGSWLDDGSFGDWVSWNASGAAPEKNRGHLYILDPVHSGAPATMTILEDLQGDDLFGARQGISSGVFGVKLDDVDGDGDNEIWCGDAAGRIYLFGNDVSPNAGWRCVYRSDVVAPYVGCYNNLHPIKGEAGETVKLLAQSPGYLTLFEVDHAAVGLELQ